ncbi:hypothetical protein GCM10027360_06750 [Amycolatopsis echigonensis]
MLRISPERQQSGDRYPILDKNFDPAQNILARKIRERVWPLLPKSPDERSNELGIQVGKARFRNGFLVVSRLPPVGHHEVNLVTAEPPIPIADPDVAALRHSEPLGKTGSAATVEGGDLSDDEVGPFETMRPDQWPQRRLHLIRADRGKTGSHFRRVAHPVRAEPRGLVQPENQHSTTRIREGGDSVPHRFRQAILSALGFDVGVVAAKSTKIPDDLRQFVVQHPALTDLCMLTYMLTLT